MREPFVIQPCLMRDEGDCAVCCLVMITGRSYGDVVGACAKRSHPTVDGLTDRQMVNAARKLGVTLIAREGTPDDDEVAILTVARTHDPSQEHAVMWLHGVILNPRDGEIWTDLEAFLKDRNWQVASYLRRES